MRPKLVILASRFPYPLIKGDKLRLYHQIRALSKSFDIHLIALNPSWPSREEYDALGKYCTSMSVHRISPYQSRYNVIRHLFSAMPMQVRYFYDIHVHADIKNEIFHIEPDVIYVQLIRMAPYISGVSENVAKSIDFMDSMILNDLAGQYLRNGIMRLFKRRERRLVANYERKVFSLFDSRFVISERDLRQFPTELQSKMSVVSNGVDTDYFNSEEKKPRQQYDIIFSGNLSYRPNIQASRFIIQKIVPAFLDIKCLISGADVGADLEKYASERIVISGYREDIRKAYQSGKIMVVPIFHGSGLQNKVLEAMSCGMPCIITSFVNEAIGAKHGKELIVTDTAKGFIEHIKSLLSHPDLQVSMGRAARSFVKKNYDWSVHTDKLVKKLELISGYG